jgi:hypothetical protein
VGRHHGLGAHGEEDVALFGRRRRDDSLRIHFNFFAQAFHAIVLSGPFAERGAAQWQIRDVFQRLLGCVRDDGQRRERRQRCDGPI